MKNAVLKYSENGVIKAKLPFWKMFVSAFTAGMFIALAGAAATVGSATFEGSAAKLIAALIFPAGLAMVIANCTELFTGNCLLVISCMDKKIKLHELLRNWCIVYFGNMAGGFFVSAVTVYGHMYSAFGGRAAESAVSAAAVKCALPFCDGLFKGILCNVMVCLAVMMALMAEKAADKIIMLFMPIFVFVVCGFEHSVANMGYIPTGIFLKGLGAGANINTSALNWYNFFVTNLIPVTLGNIIGGAMTGAAYKYLASEEKRESKKNR